MTMPRPLRWVVVGAAVVAVAAGGTAANIAVLRASDVEPTVGALSARGALPAATQPGRTMTDDADRGDRDDRDHRDDAGHDDDDRGRDDHRRRTDDGHHDDDDLDRHGDRPGDHDDD